MSFLVLALLVGLWLAILLPGAIRAHRASSPRSTVEAFRHTMERLSTRSEDQAAAGDRAVAEAEARESSARQRTLARRRTVVGVLVGGLVACGAGAAVAGAGMVWLLIADTTALSVYLGLLVGLRSRAAEARRKVAPLPARSPSPSPPPSAGTEAVSLRAAAGEHA